MKERTLTIEEMIEAGATWAEISARVKAMQREQAEKKRAEEAARAEKARKIEVAAAAKERFIVALCDWLIAEEILNPKDKAAFCEDIAETVDAFMKDVQWMQVLRQLCRG